MNKVLSLLIVTIVLASCSFKPSDDKNESSRTMESIGTAEEVDPDSDGDGIWDKDDLRPFLADVPVIEGEFFTQMDIKFLYRGEPKSINVLRNHKGVGSYYQFVSEMNSNMGDHIRSRLNSDFMNVFTFKNPKNSQTGIIEDYFNIVDRVSVEIDAEFNFRFKEGSYTNLNLELYYYNSSKKELELVSSLIIGDKFNFNERVNKKLTFAISYSNPERIVNDRGRSLFLKVKDFTIVNSGNSYSRLMSSVLSKTVPLIIFNGESFRYNFVSTSKKRLSLSQAMNRAGIDFKEIGGNVYQIDSLMNESEMSIDFFGNTVRDEKKWVVMTKNISTNHQAYSFGVGDFIYLNYVSKMNPQILRPRVVGSVGNSRKKTVHSAILKKEAFDRSRIIFRPISFKGIVTDIYKTKDCRWDICFNFSSKYHQGDSLDAMGSLYFIEMTLNNDKFNLGKLLEDKKIALKKIDGKDLFEIILGQEIKSLIKLENSFVLSFAEHAGLYCDGSSYCSGVNCESYFSANTPSCSLSNFYKDYLFYEVQLVRNMSAWDGGAYVGFESFE